MLSCAIADNGFLEFSTAPLQQPGSGTVSARVPFALVSEHLTMAFDMTLQYGNDRVQFGKFIGKFQAIQHQLSAVAKSRTSEAAQLVASLAHAIHGAIGTTAENDLRLYTRRLHEWRMAHGPEARWNRVLGQALLDSREPLIADFSRHIAA